MLEKKINPVIAKTTGSPAFAYSVLRDAKKKREKIHGGVSFRALLAPGFCAASFSPEKRRTTRNLENTGYQIYNI